MRRTRRTIPHLLRPAPRPTFRTSARSSRIWRSRCVTRFRRSTLAVRTRVSRCRLRPDPPASSPLLSLPSRLPLFRPSYTLFAQILCGPLLPSPHPVPTLPSTPPSSARPLVRSPPMLPKSQRRRKWSTLFARQVDSQRRASGMLSRESWWDFSAASRPHEQNPTGEDARPSL